VGGASEGQVSLSAWSSERKKEQQGENQIG